VKWVLASSCRMTTRSQSDPAMSSQCVLSTVPHSARRSVRAARRSKNSWRDPAQSAGTMAAS